MKSDSPTDYYAESPKPYQGKLLFFGAVRSGKAYVSYHFFPLYMFPELGAALSPALQKRRQGKACFNFKSADEEALFSELAELTTRGFESFRAKGLI